MEEETAIENISGGPLTTIAATIGCAFLTFVAAYCGYHGPIMADPFSNRIINIAEISNSFS